MNCLGKTFNDDASRIKSTAGSFKAIETGTCDSIDDIHVKLDAAIAILSDSISTVSPEVDTYGITQGMSICASSLLSSLWNVTGEKQSDSLKLTWTTAFAGVYEQVVSALVEVRGQDGFVNRSMNTIGGLLLPYTKFPVEVSCNFSLQTSCGKVDLSTKYTISTLSDFVVSIPLDVKDSFYIEKTARTTQEYLTIIFAQLKALRNAVYTVNPDVEQDLKIQALEEKVAAIPAATEYTYKGEVKDLQNILDTLDTRLTYLEDAVSVLQAKL